MRVCERENVRCLAFKSSMLCVVYLFQWWIFGTIAGVSGGLLYAIDSVNASDAKAMPSHLPWVHKDHFKGYDHARLDSNTAQLIVIVFVAHPIE